VPDEVPEIVRLDQVVGIDDANDLGVGRYLLDSEVEGSRFEAGPWQQMKEPKAAAEPCAMRLDWSPQRFVSRVVVDDQYFARTRRNPGTS